MGAAGTIIGGLDIDRLMGSPAFGKRDDRWMNVFKLGFCLGLYEALPYHERIQQEDPLIAHYARQIYIELNARCIEALFFSPDLSIVPASMILNGGCAVEHAYIDPYNPKANVFVRETAIRAIATESARKTEEEIGLEIDALGSNEAPIVVIPTEVRKAVQKKLENFGKQEDGLVKTTRQLQEMGLEMDLPGDKTIFGEALRAEILTGAKKGEEILKAVLSKMAGEGPQQIKRLVDRRHNM